MSLDPIDVHDPISTLQWIENEHDWTGSEKNRIRAVKTELWFLGTFLRMKPDALQIDIRSFMDDTGAQFLYDYYSILDGKEPHNFDTNCSNVLAKIQHYKQSIRAEFSNLEISSTSPLSHKLLVEFIDNIVTNLKDLLIVRFSEPPALHVDLLSMYSEANEQMEAVEKELRSLRNFIVYLGKICSSELRSCWQTFLHHAEFVATLAAIIFFLYMPNFNNHEFVALLSDLLENKIKPIEPRVRVIYTDVLRDIRLSSTRNMSHMEAAILFSETLMHMSVELREFSSSTLEQTKTLSEQLISLRIFLTELPLINDIQDEMRINYFRQLETVVIHAGLVVYSLCDSSKEDWQQELEALDDTIQNVKTQIYLDIREWVQSHLPKNDVLGFSNFLLDSLKELLFSHSGSLASVKSQLKVVYEELESFFKHVVKQGHNKQDELQDLVGRVVDKAYEVEYIADSFAVRDDQTDPLTYLKMWLSDIIWEIKLIKRELIKSSDKRMSTIDSPASAEELVGFKDIRKIIIGQVVGGSTKLDVISIVGTAGSGKTTLARSFIKDQQIVSHFDFVAECCVSQEYRRRDLLFSILNAYEPSELNKESNDNEVSNKLRQTLFGKRYLIIVDDVWERRAWDDLRGCFPDKSRGSRIILTTRHHEVAHYAICVTEPCYLRPLDVQESWLLLQKKVFGKEICPEELWKVGQEIAEKCKGLPLSIVSVAGLLARMDKTKQWWKRMELCFGERIQVDAKALVKLSYDDLPYKLKLCFLYFGAFFEDKEIPVSKLTRLWIAEGFIENDEKNCLEDVAEHYLEDLIGRNLVTVTKGSTGKIKACHLRNPMLEFCKEKAKEDNFLLCLKRGGGANLPNKFPEKPSHRRLAFCSNGYDDLAEWRPLCSHARSVFFREVKDGTLPSLGDASIFFGSFKFLRVLDLEFVVVKSFPTELNHLRYLAVQTTEGSLPSSIGNLLNLQTFIVKRTGKALQLPNTFWKLTKLRHVSIGDRALMFDLDCTHESLYWGPSKLEDLATLSSPYVSGAEDMEMIVRQTPNLRKLKCIIADSWGWDENENWFLALENLIKLVSLKVHFSSFPRVGPSTLIFPCNLKKLTLSNFPLPLDGIFNIAKLPNLEILQLQKVAFEREEWDVEDEAFPKLKFLKLENLELSKWEASDYGAFPCLERLVLERCLLLQEIPSCFIDLVYFKSIEVKSCSQSLAESAMDIKKERAYLGQYDFQVLV